MDLKLNNKTALVSGSTAGIGYAIAARLAQEGTEVWVNGRGRERVDSAVDRIRQAYPAAKVHGIAADLGTAEGAKRLLSELPAVDVLVNNLGIYEPELFSEITDDDWRRIFDVNVLSGIRLSRAYLPGMLKKN